MTENKIRQLIRYLVASCFVSELISDPDNHCDAVRSKQLSPHTSVTFFPLHETIGEDGKRLQGLKVGSRGPNPCP